MNIFPIQFSLFSAPAVASSARAEPVRPSTSPVGLWTQAAGHTLLATAALQNGHHMLPVMAAAGALLAVEQIDFSVCTRWWPRVFEAGGAGIGSAVVLGLGQMAAGPLGLCVAGFVARKHLALWAQEGRVGAPAGYPSGTAVQQALQSAPATARKWVSVPYASIAAGLGVVHDDQHRVDRRMASPTAAEDKRPCSGAPAAAIVRIHASSVERCAASDVQAQVPQTSQRRRSLGAVWGAAVQWCRWVVTQGLSTCAKLAWFLRLSPPKS